MAKTKDMSLWVGGGLVLVLGVILWAVLKSSSSNSGGGSVGLFGLTGSVVDEWLAQFGVKVGG